MTIGFDPRNVGIYGGGATGLEVCMTQDANQFKQAKCVAYFECNTLRSPHTSRTLSGDHEDRVTDTGGCWW